MNIATLIIGIDGWEQYTLPLVRSIRRHEPDCRMIVIDNASQTPYQHMAPNVRLERTERLSYAAAINHAARIAEDADWYIVLSNDVLCTGPFAHQFANINPDVVMGPQLWREHGQTWLVGWCVAASQHVWRALGGWDENYRVSSWEDVDFSASAIKAGFLLAQAPLPFIHLDQKQRFGLIPDYWQSEAHNRAYFMRKHGVTL